MSEKKHEVTISLNVTQEGEPFFNGVIAYHNLPYEGVVLVEQLLLGAVNKLGEVGLANVSSTELGKQLLKVLDTKKK